MLISWCSQAFTFIMWSSENFAIHAPISFNLWISSTMIYTFPWCSHAWLLNETIHTPLRVSIWSPTLFTTHDPLITIVENAINISNLRKKDRVPPVTCECHHWGSLFGVYLRPLIAKHFIPGTSQFINLGAQSMVRVGASTHAIPGSLPRVVSDLMLLGPYFNKWNT